MLTLVGPSAGRLQQNVSTTTGQIVRKGTRSIPPPKGMTPIGFNDPMTFALLLSLGQTQKR